MKDTYFLRKVKEEDIRDIFDLSNADYVRQFSINTQKIEWEDHVIWFESIKKSENTLFYVVTNPLDKFLGQLRYKVEGRSAVVSISLCMDVVGKGLGYNFLRESIKLISSERSQIDYIIAYIADENSTSKKLFEKAEFKFVENNKGLLKYIYSVGKGEV